MDEDATQNVWLSAGLKEVVTLAYTTGNILLRKSSNTSANETPLADSNVKKTLAVEPPAVPTSSGASTSAGEKTEEESTGKVIINLGREA